MKIERDILINAPLDRVWSMVSQPGWWVGADHPTVEPTVGETYLASDPTEGTFPTRVEKIDAPRYIAFRWASAFPGATPDDTNSTLIEMTLSTEGDRVRLTVVESGFDAIEAPADTRRRNYEANSGGWGSEMEKLARRASGPDTAPGSTAAPGSPTAPDSPAAR
jgi:uncharacterized protein YndB with AHSA1/START domain